MNSSVRRTAFLCFIVAAFAAGALLAQAGSTDIPNWTVPPYRASGAEGGLRTMDDITGGRAFVPIQPCRVFDTRNAVGPYGGPRLIANTTRNFDINSGPCTGIPDLAAAYSMNFGAILADGDGFITIWPAGSAQPVVSSINTLTGEVIANAAIVPAGVGGAISIFPNTGVHLYGDINGYFSVEPNESLAFQWQSDNPGTFGAAIITNTNTGTGDTFGLVARVNSTGTGTAAVNGTALAATGQTFGVLGRSMSTTSEAAGVKGVGSSGLLPSSNCCSDLGVFGESANGFGTVGMSNSTAGLFLRYSPAGTVLSFSWIATDLGSDYAFFASTGDYGGNGAKFFVEPHPTDANKVIRYVSLEGPESGTYFRGRAKFQRGMARIDVPEDFRMVTAEDGLSIQVTPIGQMATVAVLNIGLDEIVVRGSRDVEFFYTVNGVRRAYADFKPISEAKDGGEFMPMTADWKMPEYNAETKRRLILNGTYKADGTVNMETARRLGWDRIWEANEHPQPRPEPAPTP
jgi:hypothetical protein